MKKLSYIINIFIFLIFSNIAFSDNTQEELKKEQENAVLLARKGEYSKALAILDKLAKDHPENPNIAADIITLYSWSGNDESAIKNFENSLSKGIKLPIYAYQPVAISYKRTGAFSKAEEIYRYILKNNPRNGPVIREMILCLLEKKEKDKIIDLSSAHPGRDSLEKFIKEQIKIYPESRGFIKLTEADFLLKRDYKEEAEKIYKELDSDKRLEPDPQVALCKIAISQGDYYLAKEILKKVYPKFQNQAEVLFCKAVLEERDGDSIGAYNTYSLILSLVPNNNEALNGKFRSLIQLGAFSVAKAEIEKDRDKAYEYIPWKLKGDTVAYYVNAKEYRIALQQSKEFIDQAEEEYKLNPSETIKDFIIRAKFDRIIALRKLFKMEQVIDEYNLLSDKGVKVPFWVMNQVGDAYLFLKKPKKALEFFKKTLEMQKASGFDRPSDTFELKMAIHYALLESEQINEAGKLLEEIDAETPEYSIQRGVRQKNWFKSEVKLAKGWLLIYQDKLGEALDYFKEMKKKAPFNSNITASLAYTKWYRGWPRKALRDFSVSRTNAPNETNTEIGYATTLNELDQWRKARKIAAKLLKKEPKNLYVQQLNRNLYLEELPVFSAEGSFLSENSFESSGDISLKLEYPIYPKRKIYTETKWLFLSSKEDGLRRTITRSYLGTDWRLNRDLTLIGSASLDYNGENPGFMGGLIYQPTDELTLQGQFDSYSLNLPPKALLNNIKGKETTFIANYRYSENFFIEGRVDYLRLSDSNNEMKYGIRLKQTLTSNAYLKTKLGLTSSITTNSKYKERKYYSPRYRANVIAIPEIEILLYRNYDFKIISRSFLGIGPMWEARYGASVVGFIREELDFTINDQLKFLIGTTFSKDTYDGADTYGWGIDGRLEYIIDYNQIANFFK